jgi:hypothetical protein
MIFLATPTGNPNRQPAAKQGKTKEALAKYDAATALEDLLGKRQFY